MEGMEIFDEYSLEGLFPEISFEPKIVVINLSNIPQVTTRTLWSKNIIYKLKISFINKNHYIVAFPPEIINQPTISHQF